MIFIYIFVSCSILSAFLLGCLAAEALADILLPRPHDDQEPKP